MRFGFASFEIYPTTPGGAGVFLDAAARQILEDGHELVLVLSLAREEFDKWCHVDSRRLPNSGRVTNYRLADLCSDIDLGPGNFPSESYYMSYCWAWALRKISSENPLDYFEFFDYCGPGYFSLVQRLTETRGYPKRIGVRVHGTIEVIDRRVANAFANHRVFDYALERAALRLADVALAPGSSYYEDEVQSLYGPHFRDRVKILPPPIRVSPPVERAKHPRDILFVGRLSTLKGLDIFLHAAAAILSDPATAGSVGNFVVVGPREAVSSSQTEDDILGIGREWIGRRIHITGSLPQSEIRKRFAEAACAVFPHRVESYCYAAHEAFLAEVPLILSDAPAFRDHFEPDIDAVFFDGTVSSLVEKILRLARDPDLGKRLSRRRDALLDRYTVHGYPALVESVAPRDQDSASRSGLGELQVVVLHQNRTPSASGALLLGGLQASLPPETRWIDLYPANGDRGFMLCGKRMEARDRDGRNVVIQTYRLNPFVAFVDAERPPLKSFLAAAAAILARHAGIGSVVPPVTRVDGTHAVESASASLETCYLTGISHMGAVIRLGSGLTLAELAGNGGASTEIDLMLRARERGGLVVDWPMPSSAVQLPMPLNFGAGDKSLRSQAWQASGFALTSFLTSMRGESSPFRVLGATDKFNDNVSRLVSESMHHPRRVYLVANGLTDFRSSKPVTILGPRAKAPSRQAPWSACTFEGEWERTHTACAAHDHWRTRTGSLMMDLAEVEDLDIQVGPDDGAVLMLFNGRGLVLDLSSTSVGRARVSVEALFDVADGTFFAARSLTREPEADLCEDHTQTSGVVIALDRSAGVTARALRLQEANQIVDLGLDTGVRARSRTASARAIMTSSNASEMTLVGSEAVEIAADLLESSPDARITVALPRSIGWRADDYRSIKAASDLQARHPERLRVLCPDAILSPLARRLGGAPSDATLMVSSIQRRHEEISGPVELLLGPGDGEIPTRGHVASAAVMAAQLAPSAVGSIVYQRSNDDVAHVLRLFPTRAKIKVVDSIERYIQGSSEPFVLLAPYPTGRTDHLGILALERGGLVVTSPGAVPLSDGELASWLTVGYWEQSDLLAEHTVRLIDNYIDVQKRLIKSMEDARREVRH
jgi:glycosyltransferase involved in cell wall biosynthesis